MTMFKVRITSPEHSAKVQEAAFKLGYGWCGDQKTVQYANQGGLFFEASGYKNLSYITYGTAEYLDEHESPEYELIGEAFFPISERPPLGLRPRDIAEREFDQARSKEILAAMTRYSEAGKHIPSEWMSELVYRQN